MSCSTYQISRPPPPPLDGIHSVRRPCRYCEFANYEDKFFGERGSHSINQQAIKSDEHQQIMEELVSLTETYIRTETRA